MGDVVAGVRPLETLSTSGLSPITFQFPSWEKSESSDVSTNSNTIACSVTEFGKPKIRSSGRLTPAEVACDGDLLRPSPLRF